MLKDKTIQAITAENLELKELVDSFREIFDVMSEEAGLSSELLESNVKSTFANIINNAISDPVNASYGSFLAAEEVVKQLLVMQVNNFLQENSSHILKAWVNNTYNVLHYTILLNKDCLVSRSVFNDYLMKYERNHYATRFPLVMQFAPASLFKQVEATLTKQFVSVIG